MAIDIQLFPDQGLVHVRYCGVARLDDTITAFTGFMADPRSHGISRHLVDMSKMNGAAFDFPALMRLQAKKAEHFLRGEGETLIAYFAPTREAVKLAMIAQRSWDDQPAVVARTFDDEAATMAFLGLPVRRINDLGSLVR